MAIILGVWGGGKRTEWGGISTGMSGTGETVHHHSLQRWPQQWMHAIAILVAIGGTTRDRTEMLVPYNHVLIWGSCGEYLVCCKFHAQFLVTFPGRAGKKNQSEVLRSLECRQFYARWSIQPPS